MYSYSSSNAMESCCFYRTYGVSRESLFCQILEGELIEDSVGGGSTKNRIKYLSREKRGEKQSLFVVLYCVREGEKSGSIFSSISF